MATDSSKSGISFAAVIAVLLMVAIGGFLSYRAGALGGFPAASRHSLDFGSR